MTSLNIWALNMIPQKEEQEMTTSENTMTLEINGLHVILTFAPAPVEETVGTIRTILQNSYVRTLGA